MFVSLDDVKAAFLTRQGLGLDKAWSSVHEAVNQIGAVQIDTIAVVARSHHLTLRHRVQDYDPKYLWAALNERQLLEYYVHGNSFVPIEDYPYLRHCMQRFPSYGYKWLRNAIQEHKKLMQVILDRIQEEGPLASRDFKDPTHQSRGWWDWKPAKQALELLWWMGQLIVVNREGFERVYDIPERAIPSRYLNRTVDIKEVWPYYLKRALDCLTIATIGDIQNYFNFHIYALEKKQSKRRAIEEKVQILTQQDIIVEVEVPEDSASYYALRSNLPLIEDAPNHVPSRDCAWLLSPFDNIVWDRRRTSRLFQVEVKLEAYTPKAKRQFGYYSMPILWDNRIVGRLDPKVDRKTKTLRLANLELTLTEKDERDALDAIRKELTNFMSFHDCKQLKVEKSKPLKYKKVFFINFRR